VRDPKMYGSITAALQLPEIYFRKNIPQRHDATPSTSVADEHDSTHVSVVATAPSNHAPDPVPALRSAPAPASAPTSQQVSNVAVKPPMSADMPSVADSPPQASPAVQSEGTPRKATPEVVPPAAQLASPGNVGAEDESDSLFSVSLSDTPVRPHVPYDTPLADARAPVLMPTPTETPSFISAPDSASVSTGRTFTSPYVKNLTPIFASAENAKRASNEQLAGAEAASPASPVRMMDPLVSPVLREDRAARTPSFAAATPEQARSGGGDAWRTYPIVSPSPVDTPAATPASTPAHAPASIPLQTCPPGPAHAQPGQSARPPVQAGAAKIAFRANSKIQIV
jgi:hypothetical protein